MKLTFKSIAIIITLAATTAAPLHAQQTATPDKDIVDTALDDRDTFFSLTALLSAADLVDTLKGEGPFTVLAPTNEAFAKLPTGTVEALLRPENKALLTTILTNHVLAGEIPVTKALAAGGGTTLQGSKVNIRFEDTKVKIGDSNLVTADIKTTNGVIHVIDTVLIPAGTELCAPATQLTTHIFSPDCLEKVEKLRVLLNEKFPR